LRQLALALLAVIGLLGLGGSESALGADVPYEYDPALSLTGGCGISKVDPIADPGCPDKHPPNPFANPRAIAVAPSGYVYVVSYGALEGSDGRIDVFSPDGVFIAEIEDSFGPKSVAVDSKGNVYVVDQTPGTNAEISRYSPTVYKPEEGEIEYGNPRVSIATTASSFNGGVAVDASNDHVFAAQSFSIVEYGSAAENNALLDTVSSEKIAEATFVAVDSQRRRLYASSCPTGDVTKCWILVLNADDPREVLAEVEGPNPPSERFVSAKGWMSIAVDEETGEFFVGDLELSKKVFQIDADYELISTLELDPALFEGGEPLQIAVSNAPGAANHHYLFVPSLKNRALAYNPPNEQPPVVRLASVAALGETEAELQAKINPSGGTASYSFQLTTQEAYEEAGSSFSGVPVVQGGAISPSSLDAEVSTVASGLTPGVGYRFRVFAQNAAGSDEEEATFTTYADAPLGDDCVNAHSRTGYSALLPDCRAYELVTPSDTNGLAPHGIEGNGDAMPDAMVAPTGDAISFFTSGGVLPGTEGAGGLNGDRYRVARTPLGWVTESASPSGSQSTLPSPESTSPDQGFAFWLAGGEGSALIDGVASYVRYPDGRLELVGRGREGTDSWAEGKLITAGASHIVFQTQNLLHVPIQLEPDAPPTGTTAVYDRTSDEVTHVVSLLPGDVTPASDKDATFVGASPDGEGIAFTIGTTLYLRVENSETFEIGDGLTFLGVSEGGGRIFYARAGDIYAFDTEANAETPFTQVGNAIPVNVAESGRRAYFVSTSSIAGSGENPNGDIAKKGKQNLYLSEEGEIRFVATVTARDVEGEDGSTGKVDGLGLWALAIREGNPTRDPSRANRDGSVLLFQSRANLDEYDPGGSPQVYRYDTDSNRLHCLSCVPTGLAAAGGATLQVLRTDEDVSPPLGHSTAVSNLAAGGDRAFFQSAEALVSYDNNRAEDVYQWEEEGMGSCTRAGGCVYLITSGRSARPSYLYGVSASGRDVFFTTTDVLTDSDAGDMVSIYDARGGGGFGTPVVASCEGDGCRPDITQAPSLTMPNSGARRSAANAARRRCGKGMRRVRRHGKVRCLKKRRKSHRAEAGARKGVGK